MYTSVLERFPEQAERIRLLLQQDAKFAEICGDYIVLAQWLVAHDQEGCISESECAANRLLLAELEIEILQYLQTVDRQSGHQA